MLVAAFVELACASDSRKISQSDPWSRRIADSFLLRHPTAAMYDTGFTNRKWNYEQGLMLHALYQLWKFTDEKKYLDFIKKNLEQYVAEDGTIQTYNRDDFNLDNISGGRALLMVYQETKEEKYRKAANILRSQLKDQPRTTEGGFWHKKIYPDQMWLDGLFMAEPFYAQYAVMVDEPNSFDDILKQFSLISRHTRDEKTGLYYHGWDESKMQSWANPQTGCSSSFWARSMGWYAMALADVLDDIPLTHPERPEFIKVFTELSETLWKFRDTETNLWFQVVDQQDRQGNYLEASASCMFAYVFAKGANNGLLGKEYLIYARQVFQSVIENFVSVGNDGCIDVKGTCGSAGLGGKSNRDGSFEYYISEKPRTNDMKGIGSFLLAAIEIEKSDSNKREGH